LDNLFIDDVLNWDESVNLIFLDYNIFSFFITAYFVNSHFFLDTIVKLSFLDLLLAENFFQYSLDLNLFYFFLYDISALLDVNFLYIQALFYTDYQDFFLITLYHSPELIFALNDYINTYYTSALLSVAPSSVFDVYNDNLEIAISEFLEYFLLFLLFTWLIVLFLFSTRLNN
jgi:hypothetical protein